MKQLKVEFPERAPFKHEKSQGVETVIMPTLNVVFFDGKNWFPYTAKEELHIGLRDNSQEVINTLKASAERHLWRWLSDALREGSVQVNNKLVKIYGVAAEPITEEHEV